MNPPEIRVKGASQVDGENEVGFMVKNPTPTKNSPAGRHSKRRGNQRKTLRMYVVDEQTRLLKSKHQRISLMPLNTLEQRRKHTRFRINQRNHSTTEMVSKQKTQRNKQLHPLSKNARINLGKTKMHSYTKNTLFQPKKN